MRMGKGYLVHEGEAFDGPEGPSECRWVEQIETGRLYADEVRVGANGTWWTPTPAQRRAAAVEARRGASFRGGAPWPPAGVSVHEEPPAWADAMRDREPVEGGVERPDLLEVGSAEAVIEAARRIRHWHDVELAGGDGVVTSASAFWKLHQAVRDYDARRGAAA